METFDLSHIIILLAAAVLVVPIFHRLGLGSVFGYIIAGVIVGPWGLAVIHQVKEVQHIAEFGVVFLLFIIGIELNFQKLLAMKQLVFGLGTAQVVLTGVILAGLSIALGQPLKIAIVIGFGLALSSTAFVLQILNESNDLKTVAGHTSFSILLFQDLSIVPLLALVTFLAQDASLIQNVEFALLNTLIVFVAVIVIGRYVLSPILRWIAHSHNMEVFLAAAILAVLGTAWLMEMIGLSMALGAFVAGLILADSHYRHQIIADVKPFRGLLLGLFFISIGMSVDFGLLIQKVYVVLGLVVALMVIKSLIIWALCRIAKVGNEPSVRTALLLSQSGEFGFVIFGLAESLGLMETATFHILTLVIALSMVTTPLMAIIGKKLERFLDAKSEPDNFDLSPPEHEKFVILVGFGRTGKRVATILKAAGMQYLALENDPNIVTEERANGFSVVYGDAGRYDVLNTMGVGGACSIIVTIDKAGVTKQLVHILSDHYPNIPIYARAHDREHCQYLQKAGATLPVSETLEVSLILASSALSASGVSTEEVDLLMKECRDNYYTTLEQNG